MPNNSQGHEDIASRALIDSLPKTALQAIYHAVTGKTENYSKSLNGNVRIQSHDIDRLYESIIQQIEHYTVIAPPTTTIIVKTSNSKSIQYSSWERFKVIQVNIQEVTSEVAMKIEFVAMLPNTDTPQRCIINILLDSSLPVIISRQNNDEDMDDDFGYIYFVGRDWRTVKISIDFVDFLIARLFTSIIEEWFNTLEKIQKPALTNFVSRNIMAIGQSLSALGRLGFAFFLIGLAYFSGDQIDGVKYIMYAISIALMLWVFVSLTVNVAKKWFLRRLGENILPSIILLTDGDKSACNKIDSKRNSTSFTLTGLAGTVVLGILINVISSYIYSKAWNQNVPYSRVEIVRPN